MLMCALFLPIAHETAGAARIRHSLRPLFYRGRRVTPNLGRNAPRDREGVSSVIASDAKQSMWPYEERMDCFAALAMPFEARSVDSNHLLCRRAQSRRCR